MQTSTEPVMQPEWRQNVRPEPDSESPTDLIRWLMQAQRFSLVRAHISIFAVGSVLLLSINLLAGSPRVWASTWIGAWALLILMHSIIAGIATLAIKLLAEDDEIRPASEVSWEPAATWTAVLIEPESVVDEAQAQPDMDPWHVEPTPPDDDNRVSWKAASDAAWLARPTGPDPDELQTSDTEPADTVAFEDADQLPS